MLASASRCWRWMKTVAGNDIEGDLGNCKWREKWLLSARHHQRFRIVEW
jgi:hypothetical protein